MAMPLLSVRVASENNPTTGSPQSTESDIPFGSLLDLWGKPIGIAAAYYSAVNTLSYADRCDLEQAGRVALWQSASRYDSTRGTPFVHYARRAIRNAMCTILKGISRDRKYLKPLEENVDDADNLGEEIKSNSAATEEQPEDNIDIELWVQGLEPKQQQLFDLLYRQDLSQHEAALILNLSQPRIAQLHQDMLMRAKHEFSEYST